MGEGNSKVAPATPPPPKKTCPLPLAPPQPCAFSRPTWLSPGAEAHAATRSGHDLLVEVIPELQPPQPFREPRPQRSPRSRPKPVRNRRTGGRRCPADRCRGSSGRPKRSMLGCWEGLGRSSVNYIPYQEQCMYNGLP